MAKQLGDYFSVNDATEVNVIDVGSNTGQFICLLERYISVNEAILFEPVRELLEYSKVIHADKGFHYEPIALGADDRTDVIHVTQDPTNLGLSKVGTHTPHSRKIFVRKFDGMERYSGFKPDLIKIDAEGMDVEVMEGMRSFLSNLEKKPVIVYEQVCGQYNINPPLRKSELKRFDFLAEMGYNPVLFDSFIPKMGGSADIIIAIGN